MEEVVDRARRRGIHARRLDQILEPRALNRLHGPEMMQQRALARRPDARNLVEWIFHQFALALGPMRADCESVSFVAQTLNEIQRRITRRELECGLARLEECLAACIPIAPLGDADQADVVLRHADFGQCLARRLQLTQTAIDEHEIGP